MLERFLQMVYVVSNFVYQFHIFIDFYLAILLFANKYI